MLARFYLSGPFSASTLSDNFTIVGNPGNYITTGVTKTEMQYPSYKEIVFLDSVTGGTVTAVGGTCNGTSVNWSVIQATPTPTPTPTPSPEPTRNTATQASSSKSSTVISDAAIVSPQAGTAQETSADVTHRIEGGIFDDEQGSTKKSGTAEWEVKREGLF